MISKSIQNFWAPKWYIWVGTCIVSGHSMLLQLPGLFDLVNHLQLPKTWTLNSFISWYRQLDYIYKESNFKSMHEELTEKHHLKLWLKWRNGKVTWKIQVTHHVGVTHCCRKLLAPVWYLRLPSPELGSWTTNADGKSKISQGRRCISVSLHLTSSWSHQPGFELIQQIGGGGFSVYDAMFRLLLVFALIGPF
jgi:hypothetical protein